MIIKSKVNLKSHNPELPNIKKGDEFKIIKYKEETNEVIVRDENGNYISLDGDMLKDEWFESEQCK